MVDKTIEHTLVDERQRKLWRARKLVRVIGIFFLIIVGLLFWGLYTQGFYNTQAIINNCSEDIVFIVIEVLLFVMLINMDMDFVLHTQVLHNGQVKIVAINVFQKEIFCVVMKRQPKRKQADPDVERDVDGYVEEQDAFNGVTGQQVAPAATWRFVDDHSDTDDVTSQS